MTLHCSISASQCFKATQWSKIETLGHILNPYKRSISSFKTPRNTNLVTQHYTPEKLSSQEHRHGNVKRHIVPCSFTDNYHHFGKTWWLHLLPWQWRRQVCLKCWCPFTLAHSIASLKVITLISTALKPLTSYGLKLSVCQVLEAYCM